MEISWRIIFDSSSLDVDTTLSEEVPLWCSPCEMVFCTYVVCYVIGLLCNR